jgi:DNA-binding response OmpR family regulator
MVLAKPLSRILYVDDDPSMRELVRGALDGQAAGAADVIELPVDPAELPRLVRAIWRLISD